MLALIEAPPAVAYLLVGDAPAPARPTPQLGRGQEWQIGLWLALSLTLGLLPLCGALWGLHPPRHEVARLACETQPSFYEYRLRLGPTGAHCVRQRVEWLQRIALE